MKKIQKKNLFPYSDSNKRYHTVDYFYKQKHKLMIKFLRSCIQFLENILKKMI